jgi:zinc and cadmium transporter
VTIPDFSVFTWIILSSLIGGALSVAGAALVALNVKKSAVPMLISLAIGAMLGAVFLEILPEAIEAGAKNNQTIQQITGTVLIGILLFFALEKLVIWRHCHGDHCEVHAIHGEDDCPENMPSENKHIEVPALQTQYRAASSGTQASRMLKTGHSHSHSHDSEHNHERSGMMIMIGDTFHNFVDGILIASAFMVDVKVGIVTSIAIIAHEIPQEVGDFLILLHSGYSKQKAFLFNLVSSLATLVGGVAAYYALQTLQVWVPYILSLAAASLLYVSVADLIPSLHKRTELRASISQLSLILCGVASILIVDYLLK